MFNIKTVITIFILLIPVTIYATPKNYGSVQILEITSIYDADTFRATIEGWPPIIGQHMSIRVNGVDAPELRGKCEAEKIGARKAKKVTVALLRGAKIIELQNMKRGKYFRIIADVYVDGENLAAILIKKGLARPYDGGTRKDWC